MSVLRIPKFLNSGIPVPILDFLIVSYLVGLPVPGREDRVSLDLKL